MKRVITLLVGCIVAFTSLAAEEPAIRWAVGVHGDDCLPIGEIEPALADRPLSLDALARHFKAVRTEPFTMYGGLVQGAYVLELPRRAQKILVFPLSECMRLQNGARPPR